MIIDKRKGILECDVSDSSLRVARSQNRTREVVTCPCCQRMAAVDCNNPRQRQETIGEILVTFYILFLISNDAIRI